MINTKKCRQDFLSILKEIKNLNNKSDTEKILQKINKLSTYIEKEYLYGPELPNLCHKTLENLSQDMDKIESYINKYYLSLYYDLSRQAQIEKNSLIKLSNILLKKYANKAIHCKKIKPQFELNKLIQKYKKIFGSTLVDKSFKEGLNILENMKNKFFKHQSTFEKNIYNNSMTQYPPAIVEKYLCKSLISNIIFETKNNDNIDTYKLIKIVDKLKQGEI